MPAPGRSDGPILVTGGSGQVGGAVQRLARARGIVVDAPGRERLDLADSDALAVAVGARPWRMVINCAAYTAVDRAESQPTLAHAINASAPAALAEATAHAGIPLLHVSTDYVFDGSKPAPYLEEDATAPLGVYAKTKLAGEEAIRAVHPNHAIVRTAWVIGDGANFLDTMLRLAATRDEVRVVDDQRGCPTNADDLAATLLALVDGLGARSGTWHFVNSGEATWHDLAAYIFAAAGKRGLRTPRLVAIPSAEYPTPAPRPANSRLATQRIERDFALAPRPWQAAIDAVLAARLKQT